MIHLEATTNFGLEAVLKREMIGLGLNSITVTDGLVSCQGKYEDIGRMNLWLRTAERVHIVLATFPAETFEDLYQGVSRIPWGDLLPLHANFITEAKSKKSKLFSLSDIQRISERAIVDCLQKKYQKSWFDKDGARFKIGIRLMKDQATIYMDTSGVGLHDRGYRMRSVTAPLTETIGAALVLLSYWNRNRLLADPFCGSGTILIEAAMIGRNIAPGLNRKFDFEYWPMAKEIGFKETKTAAYEEIQWEGDLSIIGSDIDRKAIEAARYNVEQLGLEEDIKLFVKDVSQVDYEDNYGVLITNPPYGVRLGQENEMEPLYRELGKLKQHLPTWSFYVITSLEQMEKFMKAKADRKRKLYNGTIKVDYYQFYGPRPEKGENNGKKNGNIHKDWR